MPETSQRYAEPSAGAASVTDASAGRLSETSAALKSVTGSLNVTRKLTTEPLVGLICVGQGSTQTDGAARACAARGAKKRRAATGMEWRHLIGIKIASLESSRNRRRYDLT
jgi:hypothetical protein